MKDVVEPCEACQKPVRSEHDFCEACGAPVPPVQKKRLKDLHGAANADFTPRAQRVVNTRKALGGVSLLFVIGGVASFIVARGTAAGVLQALPGADASTPLPQVTMGATTVGELRGLIEREAWQLLGLNLFLALVMLVLWRWSRRAALPAVITALGIYLAVLLASALYDPLTLAQGIILKVVVIAALAKGLTSALTARRLGLAR